MKARGHAATPRHGGFRESKNSPAVHCRRLNTDFERDSKLRISPTARGQTQPLLCLHLARDFWIAFFGDSSLPRELDHATITIAFSRVDPDSRARERARIIVGAMGRRLWAPSRPIRLVRICPRPQAHRPSRPSRRPQTAERYLRRGRPQRRLFPSRPAY